MQKFEGPLDASCSLVYGVFFFSFSFLFPSSAQGLPMAQASVRLL